MARLWRTSDCSIRSDLEDGVEVPVLEETHLNILRLPAR
jgi:hypothetical protein